MQTIQIAISTIPNDRIAFSTATTTYSYGDIFALIEKNQTTINFLRNSSIAINGRGRLEFALLLSILDGETKSILFLPSDIDEKLHQQYYEETHINYEVFLKDDVLCYNDISPISIGNEIEKSYTKWIIPTSGTTYIPKLVSHTFESLTRTAKRSIELGGKYRWGLVFDIYRFSGIQVFLQSILSGSMLIITESTQNISEILSTLVEKKCNALSATPSFWRKVLMSPESGQLQLERITLGGEIADGNTLKTLKKKYPTAKISHIYASTEVGVGFSVTDGNEGFPKSFLNGLLPNIKMKIDTDGLLWIAPSSRNQSYISKTKMYDQDGYINTGDLVELKNERVYFLGRNSGAINVGGNKVQPEEVESKLLSSGMIAAAYVYAMNNPMMGSLVCADVVLIDQELDKKVAKATILKHCRESMEGFKVPAILKFVKELKTTQSGKLKRETK